MKQVIFKTFALAVAMLATPAVDMSAITEWGNSETTSWTAPTSGKYDHGSTVTLSGVVITLGTTDDEGIQWEGKGPSNNGIVPGTMPNTDGSASTLITTFQSESPYGTLPTRGCFLKIVPSEDGQVTITCLPSTGSGQNLVFVTATATDPTTITSASINTSTSTTSLTYDVKNGNVYYFFQLAFSDKLSSYRFTLRGLSFRPSMSAAKSALYDAIQAANTLKTSNSNKVGTAPFTVTSASFEALESAISTAQTVYNAEHTDEEYTAAKETLEAASKVEWNKPDSNTYYYIDYTTSWANLNMSWNDKNQLMCSSPNIHYAVKFVNSSNADDGTPYYKIGNAKDQYIQRSDYDLVGNTLDLASEFIIAPTDANGNVTIESLGARGRYIRLTSGQQANTAVYCGSLGYGTWKVTEATELSATASVTSALWGTFVAPFDVNFSGTDITAYTVTLNEGKDAIVTTEVTDGQVAANTPVLIHAESATNHDFTGYSSAYYTGQPTDGVLTGTLLSGTSAPAGSYLLQKQDAGVGFYYLGSAAAINQYRAWLTVPAETPVKAFVLNDQLTDAINAIASQGNGSAEYFNVSGTRLSQPTRGINIVRTADGKTKKLVVK